jgi:hypothetical protein
MYLDFKALLYKRYRTSPRNVVYCIDGYGNDNCQA